ncbi:MAG: hypothetical protein A4E66_01513 [Syntrophus sp. PtaB.Bin001]|nr:MAG: hypothetical protein A4E66_01513 [Syntrophus sp. PtaB.Bin001]
MIAEGFHLLFDIGNGIVTLRLYQNKRGGESCGGYVTDRPVIGSVQGRDTEKPPRGDSCNTDDDSAVIVYFELRADSRIAQFGELGILDHNKGVFCIDVVDLSFNKFRASIQARIVQSDDGCRLIGAVSELYQRTARIERYGIFDAIDAPDCIKHITRQGNAVCRSIDGGINYPDLGADVKNCGRGTVQNTGEHRGHHDNQKNRKGNAD